MTTPQSQDQLDFTVETLKNTGEGIEEFRKTFTKASDAFEDGRDSEGFQTIRDIHPHLQEFANFCGTLRTQCENWLSEDDLRGLDDLNQKFSQCLTTLIEAMENGDVLEIADLLRADLSEIIGNYNAVFSDIRDKLTS